MNKITTIIIGIVLIGASFFSGVKYAQSKTPIRGNFTTFGSGSQRGTRGNPNVGGVINGDIIAKDNSSITIKMRDGSTKIIFVSDSTNVMKFVQGNLSDLTI